MRKSPTAINHSVKSGADGITRVAYKSSYIFKNSLFLYRKYNIASCANVTVAAASTGCHVTAAKFINPPKI